MMRNKVTLCVFSITYVCSDAPDAIDNLSDEDIDEIADTVSEEGQCHCTSAYSSFFMLYMSALACCRCIARVHAFDFAVSLDSTVRRGIQLH